MKKFICLLFAVILCFSTTACKKDDPDSSGSGDSSGGGNTEAQQQYNPETRPFTMSIGAMDGTFNPFFFTAQNDGNVVSLTQVSMLSSDENGNPVVGEDRPTVAKDFEIKEIGYEGSDDYSTEYTFLIKNGMKFSDGNDLTVMDVLFNFYVYLDEAYTGSNTLYSTDIKGLKAYRMQDGSLEDDAENDVSATFYSNALARRTDVLNYCNNKGVENEEQVKKDIVTILNLFKDEVKTDWTNVENSFSSRDKDTYEYSFTETWQAYYLSEGLISVLTTTNANGATVERKDENGKYMTSLDEEGSDHKKDIEEYALNEANIKKYTDTGAKREDAIEYLKRDYAINSAYMTYTGIEDINAKITTIDGLSIDKLGIAKIVQYWATGSKALETFAAEERTAYYEGKLEENDGKMAVPTVSGITAYRTETFKGKDLGEAHDVVKIVINGVDPKAIWNFAVTVAPMHYYSTPELTAEADADYQNYLNAYEAGNEYTLTKFGVKFSDVNFFGEGGLQAGDKNRLPIGAGSYRASSASGGEGTANSFYNNKFVYYERNPYFNTMGEKLENAIIKNVRYAELGDDKVLSALMTKGIDYGMPSGNAENAAQINQPAYSFLDSFKYDSNGYGYVGINPKFVPDVEVRRAIMKALNTASTVSTYYTLEWAKVIYRPMSETSWAYPKGVEEHESITYTTQADDINDLIRSAGYSVNGNGIWQKGDVVLKLTFTIAGSAKDHPAFQMFKEAETFLEENCHMDITVSTDVQALKKLASGNLAVWAAAWSSAIDPDMFQVYHKDSKATSVKNWNYPEILADTTGKWSYEQGIIDDLSYYIDLARETTSQESRAAYYKDALDLVMELAVELPTYQRKDYEVFNKEVIDKSTLTQNPTNRVSAIDRIWEINYN